MPACLGSMIQRWRQLGLKKNSLRSLRIMHRHCGMPPQDVTHPSDVSPFFPSPWLPLCFHSILSLASCLYLPFSLTVSLPADSEYNKNLNVNTQQMSYFNTMCFNSNLIKRISLPSSSYLQLGCFGVTPNDSLVDAGSS